MKVLGSNRVHAVFVAFVACAAVLTLAACFFSYDFYHPDEHFQVLEFSSYKLGVTPAADLPWEFEAQIRPWFQPAVYFLVIKALSAIGIENPFSWAFFLRALSMCLSLAAIILLMKSAFILFKGRSQAWVTVILLAGLCYIPYLSVRTSSETFSAAFFWISVGIWVLGTQPNASNSRAPSKARALLCGVLFGLAFESRYQSAILVLGFLVWILMVAQDRKLSHIAIMCGGGLLIVAAGLIVDRWGYGRWTLTPFNYVYQNLVLKRANEFGTDPFWGYLKILTKESFGGGLILLACMVVSWFRRPRSIMTWISAPFFIIHCILPHKEARFLFPLVLASPFFIVDAVAPQIATGQSSRWSLRSLGRSWAVWILFALNLGAYVLLIISINQPVISAQRYLFGRRREANVVYAATDADPYAWNGHPMLFYRPESVRVRFSDIQASVSEQHPVFFISHAATPPAAPAGKQARLVFQTSVPLTDTLKTWLHVGRKTNNSARWPFFIYELD